MNETDSSLVKVLMIFSKGFCYQKSRANNNIMIRFNISDHVHCSISLLSLPDTLKVITIILLSPIEIQFSYLACTWNLKFIKRVHIKILRNLSAIGLLYTVKVLCAWKEKWLLQLITTSRAIEKFRGLGALRLMKRLSIHLSLLFLIPTSVRVWQPFEVNTNSSCFVDTLTGARSRLDA